MSDATFNLPAGYLDAFGRQRVSQPTTLADYQQQYGTSPLLWQDAITGSATSAHLPNESSVRLRCTTAANDQVIRQTRLYHRYQPGKSQLVLMTFVMGEAKEGVRKRAGYFDGANGIFLEQTLAGLRLVRRTNATGTPVDNVVEQRSWSLDNRLGGYGESILDMSKSQILAIDLEWLGVGRVRVGFVVESGAIVYVHEFRNTNTLGAVYMTTANLPLRYEITNTAEAASTTDLITICGSVISEGGFEEGRGYPFVASTGATGVSCTTEKPILSIRPADTLNSIVNRVAILPSAIDILARSKSAVIRVWYGATLTNASWGAVNATHSATSLDVAATAITGGIKIAEFFIPASAAGVNRAPGSGRIALTSRLPLALNIAGGHPTTAAGDPTTDSITITAETAESPDATLVHAAIAWQEIR
jgi:hypothetical protein